MLYLPIKNEEKNDLQEKIELMILKNIIGGFPVSDSPRARRARIHQGWWRAFVLDLEQGMNPVSASNPICSRLPSESNAIANFISSEIGSLALKTAHDHNSASDKSGMIEIERLRTNLLSSQPLCFNFFGLIALDHALGLQVVNTFYPDIDAFHGVKFEYAPSPKQKYTNDNSAFDVALDVSIKGDRGIIGIECKYTESFSEIAYDKERYREIYNASSHFIWGYEELTVSRYNQLFRNQLIAESLLQAGDYKFVKTALFCAPDDENAKKTAEEFVKGIGSDFKTIDFMDYLSAIQRLNISIQQREESMMLWARYMAYDLSDAVALQCQSSR
jgi:hypothetical protein